MPSYPNKLDLYRLSVQHPDAEAATLARIYRYHRKREALTLKEDYAGTSAIAAMWVASHPHRQAIAVDHDEHVLRYGWRWAQGVLRKERLDDLHLVCSDVLQQRRPRVDVAAALNFSALYNRDEESMLRYLRSSRASLAEKGVFVMDLFGGPGAVHVGKERRRVRPPKSEGIEPFTYVWEQRHHEPATGRIDCRIHFEFGRRVMRNAFRYDWRLWTIPELTYLLKRAGFAQTAIWSEAWNHRRGRGTGTYYPVKKVGTWNNHLVYIVGLK